MTASSTGFVYCEQEDCWLWFGSTISPQNPQIKRSTDGGLTWPTLVHSGNYDGDRIFPSSIADNGAGIQAFVGKDQTSIGDTYCYYTLDNGTSWTRSASVLPGNVDARKLFFLNGAWYAAGEGFSIWRNANTIPDGGWTRVYSSGAGTFSYVSWIVYEKGKFFATRQDLNEPLLTSTDGITWSIKTSGFGTYGDNALAYDPDTDSWAACSGTNFKTSDDDWDTNTGHSGWGSLTGCHVARVEI
jgi:hypothetical protein